MAPMRVFRRLLPTLALFVVPALAAQRQWNWGLTGGPSFHSDDRWHRLSNLGPSIQAYAEHRLTGRLAGRAELHVFYYGLHSPPTFMAIPVGCNATCTAAAGTGPTDEHPVRAGVNTGLGFELGQRGLLELRYHWIAGWKGGGLSVGGLALGMK